MNELYIFNVQIKAIQLLFPKSELQTRTIASTFDYVRRPLSHPGSTPNLFRYLYRCKWDRPFHPPRVQARAVAKKPQFFNLNLIFCPKKKQFSFSVVGYKINLNYIK